MNMKCKILAGMLVAGMAGQAFAGPIQFDFKDPKGVNNVVFQLDAPLEAINGSASGISGSVTFDTENPASVKGRIVVAAASLQVPHDMMKSHLHGKDWMDVPQFPEISFEAVKAGNVKTRDTITTADLTGKLTIKGVSKTLTVPVTFTYLKDKLRARGGPQPKDGDILVVRSSFSIKRADFNINPGKFEDKVSNEILLKLSLAGFAPR